MSKKRILLVSPFPPSLGGVSVSVQRLHDTLRLSGYRVVRYNTHFVNRRLNRSKALKFIKYMLLPVFLIASPRFDIIHLHVSGVIPKLYVALWRKFFSKKTKFIISIHGQINHLLTSRFSRYSLEKFDRIICVKEGDGKNMPSEFKARTVEIPAFIPPYISNGSVIPVPVKNFLESNSIKILVNGFIIINDKFHDLYGLKDSVLLIEQLRSRGYDADLIVVLLGYPYNEQAGHYLNTLKEYAAVRHLGGNICWVENTSMELWPLLKKVQIFLRPTKSDGDALSLREALWLKVPAVASDAVPRPAGTVVYSLNSPGDLLNKVVNVIENYDEIISGIGENAGGFAKEIIMQYETS